MGIFDNILPTKRIETVSIPPKQYHTIGAKLLHTKKIEAANDGTPSSVVGDSSEFFIITPVVPFVKAWEYYTTVPKVANVVEDDITEIQARDWYFDLKEDDARLKTLNDWHAKFNLDRIKEQVMREWKVCGTNIIGKSDWQPLQLSSVYGVKRDKNGKIVKILQQPRNNGAVSFNWTELDPDDFIISPYIEYDRKAFGASLITALASTFIYDNGEKNTSLPILSIDRIMLQDMGRIHHRFASPKRIIAFDDVNQDVIDKDVAPLIENQGPGDTLVINQLPEQLNDNLDGKSRYDEDVQRVEDTVDIGLQSSSNRVLTKPSSMADTGEAGAQDDTRKLGDMKKFSRWFNTQALPVILGSSYDPVKDREIFKFGTKDRMEVNPSELHQWILDGVMGKTEVREILRNTGTKLDDALYEKDMAEKEQQRQDMMGMKMQAGDKKGGPEDKKPEPDEKPEPPK